MDFSYNIDKMSTHMALGSSALAELHVATKRFVYDSCSDGDFVDDTLVTGDVLSDDAEPTTAGNMISSCRGAIVFTVKFKCIQKSELVYCSECLECLIACF